MDSKTTTKIVYILCILGFKKKWGAEFLRIFTVALDILFKIR